MTLLSLVFAQLRNPAVPSIEGETGVTFFSKFIPRVISVIFIVGVVAFMIMFILGGIKWITSSGDKGAVETARNQIIQALTGIFLLFAVFAVARLMKTLFGIELLTIDLTTVLP